VTLTGNNQHARTEICSGATLYTTHFAWTFLGTNSALSGDRPVTRHQKSETVKKKFRSVNTCNLLESYRRFGVTYCCMCRIEEEIFSRWDEHVPQHSWPLSTTSHNVTSRNKELHKRSEPRFELRASRMWLRSSNRLAAAFDGSLKWSTQKRRNREEGETIGVCRHSSLSGSCPCFRKSHSECQGSMLSPAGGMPLVEWLCRSPKQAHRNITYCARTGKA
jgi:hypothetical protein